MICSLKDAQFARKAKVPERSVILLHRLHLVAAFQIRTTAVYTGTPIMTTVSSAKAAAQGIAALKERGYQVKTVQEYH